MAPLVDELHVDVEEESEPQDANVAQDVPVDLAAPVPELQLAERQEKQQESVATNKANSVPAFELTDSPGPSSGSRDGVQPPDITSTIGQSQPNRAVGIAQAEPEERPADILEQVPLTDRQVDSDSSGPSKPPRQFTVEPDIVASTKKAPPSRPPPPSGGPPPRPPPPSWQSVPAKKSQECLRLNGLEGRENHTQLMAMCVRIPDMF